MRSGPAWLSAPSRVPGLLVLLAAPLAARETALDTTLDVLDGETLYQNGWLFTLGYRLDQKEGLWQGRESVSDPLDRRQSDHRTVLGAHYGLRHDLQLSAVLPYEYRVLELDDPAGPDRLNADGVGDLAAALKWRFYRFDAPHQALNLALLAGLEFPTGSDHERDGGRRLPPDLQPGSGSWDPLGGLAVTYEPYRWRFSGFFLYQGNGENSRGFRSGDQAFAELSAGNRFWLEPYPGPFLRADLLLRYRGEGTARQDGRRAPDQGGDLVTVGANLAFRPQPALDFQLALELPVYQRVNGLQLAEELSVTFIFGYRL